VNLNIDVDETGVECPPEVAARAQGYFPFPLDPFQLAAIASLDAGRSVVVCAPTGSGKTVVGEYAVYAALEAGGRVFYTTPLKALSNQKFRDFGRLLGEEKVGLLTGDISINRDAPVVVMTTEVYRNMLYASGARRTGTGGLGRVDYVVLDECHYINDAGRGTVWEESVICSPRSIQLVALSATIANAEQLAAWFRRAHGPTDLIYSDRRPVPLRFHYFQNGELSPLFKRRGPASRRPLINGRGGRFTRAWEAQADEDEVVRALAERDLLPAIYFVFSRRGCEHALRRASYLELVSSEEFDELEGILAAELKANPSLDHYPFLRELHHGMAVHHAGLLPAWKMLIERLFQAGLIKVVFATETLAAGINMPARTTVISALSKRGDTGYRSLTASEFLQMSGRAGRRGMDTVGHVVAVADPFRAAAEAVALASAPPDPLTSRFSPTYGMVLNLLDRHTPGEAEALLRRSFGQFLADGGRPRVRERKERRREKEGGRRREGPARSLYWGRFQALQSILEEYDYLYNDRPTDEGRLAAALRVENELFVAEVLRSDAWVSLDVAGFGALLTAILTEELRPDVRVHVRPGKKVNAALDRVRPIAQALRRAQAARRVETPVRLQETLCGLVQLWAEGADWETVAGTVEMDEGDIVHLMRRLLDLLRQIPQAPGLPDRLVRLAERAARAIDRQPVNEVL
jgi:superfamily II RNA helicase